MLESTRRRPTPTPTPVPIPNVLGVSISWPDGTYSIGLDAGDRIPHPVALVHVDGPGRIIVQWQLDGNAFHTESGRAKKAGDIRFDLDAPLPRRGSHSISFVIISPPLPPLASPTPAPAIRYSAP